MNPLPVMILIATLAGIFAAGATWLLFDFGGLAGRWFAERREKKRLRGEAAAIRESGSGDFDR